MGSPVALTDPSGLRVVLQEDYKMGGGVSSPEAKTEKHKHEYVDVPGRITPKQSGKSHRALSYNHKDLPEINYVKHENYHNANLCIACRHFIENRKSDPTAGKYSPAQEDPSIASMKYGNSTVLDAGCEAIAIHNTLIALGRESSLSAVVDVIEHEGLYCLGGKWGMLPSGIMEALRFYDIPFEAVKKDNLMNEGYYIISYFNNDDGSPWGGIHTVFVEYDGETYTAYNIYYDEQYSKIDISSISGKNFIRAFYIKNS